MPILSTIKKVFDVVKNDINAAVGYQQTIDELLENGDVTRAIGMLEDRSKVSMDNLREYNAKSHKVMDRPDKAIYDKNGNFLRNKPVNRIAIPYQFFINEIALVFMYGRPVKWYNKTPNDDAALRKELMAQYDLLEEEDEQREAIQNQIDLIDAKTASVEQKFSKYKSLMEKCRFDAHIREAKRIAGCEGCSAMLFHTYKDGGKAKMLIKVLSKEKNDDIYTLFDQYDQLVVFAWGYTTIDANRRSVRHYEVYKSDVVYHCEQTNSGSWDVVSEPNIIGKIPAIVFIQETEWNGTESIIERIEDAYSKNADTNDNFGDPALVATADIVNTLPKQEEESKLYVLKNGGDIKYLERANNNQCRADEIDALDEQAMTKSFTPNITLDELKGLQNASGATLRQVMLLATIKADKRKETHDGYLSRTSSLVLTIMEKVLYIADGGYSDMVIGHEFQEPFGSDLSQVLSDALKQYGAGAMSLKSVLEQSYLVQNVDAEMETIKKEKMEEDARKRENNKMDIFGLAE